MFSLVDLLIVRTSFFSLMKYILVTDLVSSKENRAHSSSPCKQDIFFESCLLFSFWCIVQSFLGQICEGTLASALFQSSLIRRLKKLICPKRARVHSVNSVLACTPVHIKTDLLLILQQRAGKSNFLTFHGLELRSLFSIDETRSVPTVSFWNHHFRKYLNLV